MKTKMILVIYLNVGNIEKDGVEKYCKDTMQSMKTEELKKEGIRVIIIPTRDSVTRIDSIVVPK